MTSTKEIMQLDITLHCYTIETCNNEIAIILAWHLHGYPIRNQPILTIVVLVHVCNKTQQKLLQINNPKTV